MSATATKKELTEIDKLNALSEISETFGLNFKELTIGEAIAVKIALEKAVKEANHSVDVRKGRIA